MAELADVSIVMLTHNGREYTDVALGSILAAAVLPRQLLLVNNGSTDGTRDLLAVRVPQLQAAGIDVITWDNPENTGCSVARNAAWARATAEYVMFLDNDTAVCTRAWLPLLAAEMTRHPEVAVLGPKLIYPFVPHLIQCAGVMVNRLGRIRFRGRGAPRDDPRFASFAAVPLLISACWLMRRRLLAEVGGLDPIFYPVQYEDLDFCMRVTAAGYQCAYTPTVEVYHFEGGTTAARGLNNYTRNIAVQSAKFRARWREVLSRLPADREDYRWVPTSELGLSRELDLRLG